MQSPVFTERLLQALCSWYCELFAGHEASQAGHPCAEAPITLSSAVCERCDAYWEQTDLKVSRFLILKDKTYFFQDFRVVTSDVPGRLVAAFPFVLAMALPGTSWAVGIAGFEHSCHVG